VGGWLRLVCGVRPRLHHLQRLRAAGKLPFHLRHVLVRSCTAAAVRVAIAAAVCVAIAAAVCAAAAALRVAIAAASVRLALDRSRAAEPELEALRRVRPPEQVLGGAQVGRRRREARGALLC